LPFFQWLAVNDLIKQPLRLCTRQPGYGKW
jgi:hypothetical protein